MQRYTNSKDKGTFIILKGIEYRKFCTGYCFCDYFDPVPETDFPWHSFKIRYMSDGNKHGIPDLYIEGCVQSFQVKEEIN